MGFTDRSGDFPSAVANAVQNSTKPRFFSHCPRTGTVVAMNTRTKDADEQTQTCISPERKKPFHG
jgi:hypothetical protein